MTKNRKVLLVYSSRQGQTEKIAGFMADQFGSLGYSVDKFNARDSIGELHWDAYDLVVCGGSFQIGKTQKELVNFIKSYADPIQKKPNAFFLVLLSAATKDPVVRKQVLDDAEAKLRKQLPISFSRIEMIAGALTYSKYSWPIKWIMKRIARHYGEQTQTDRDYEFTDWEQVRNFVNSLS